jgi:hypothetical protein
MPGQKVKVRTGKIMPPGSSEPDVAPLQVAPASTATPAGQASNG